MPLAATVELRPVASGLASPLFVGHAGDGSNRLFIVERAGTIRVLQPGSSTPTLFLDIRASVLAGGERGLLGLAFHPQYAANGRFFVYYTRSPDGALAIAEYGVSADRDVASTAERSLLTIAHPAGNHNGGMLAFGPDAYLYVGVGDGGGANDPPNNAQNIDSLLGKILRIDVDTPDPVARTPYSSPSDNPFVGRAGRDEIYAFGMRNPWRFSFDRSTGEQWVGDVGQDAREEVDAPIARGGNYGWRTYEGTVCTNLNPADCNPANFLPPRFEYAHTQGRCSVTGGYVYRGSRGTLPLGTYVYGDYCTGEMLAWDGSAQSLLLETSMNIASFGEDEQGELYVVGLGGTVSRITSTAAEQLQNEGFEAPALGAGYQYSPAGGGIGWSFDAGAGIQGNGSAWEAAPAPQGTQTAFIQGLGSFEQTLQLAAGTYTLSFAAARRSYSNPPGSVQPIRVSIDGAPIGALVTPSSTAFATFTLAFTVTSSGPHTLRFAGTDGSGDKSTFIDAVAISQ